MAKRKLPSNFGPKDLSKLPAGLRAYWEKKRKGTSSEKPNSSKKTKTAPKTAKPAKKSQKTAVRGKKTAPKRTTATKPSREGVRSLKTGKALLKARGTAKK